MDKNKIISDSENETIIDLRRIIGISSTAALVEKCGGSFIYIPLMKSLEKAERDRKIYEEFEAGYTYKQLALKYSLAAATIREITKNEAKKKKLNNS